MTQIMKNVGQLRTISLGAILAVTVFGFLLGVSPNAAFAFPHETRIVGSGKYQLVVGFRNEPAFENVVNALDIFVTRASDARPINTSVGDVVDLTVEVQFRNADTFSSSTIIFATLDKPSKAFGTDNKYSAWFKPNVDGAYAFHITGTISDLSNPVAGSVAIDETFVCGGGSQVPGHGFNCVRDPQLFPNKHHNNN